jgi:hypothetical protein
MPSSQRQPLPPSSCGSERCRRSEGLVAWSVVRPLVRDPDRDPCEGHARQVHPQGLVDLVGPGPLVLAGDTVSALPTMTVPQQDAGGSKGATHGLRIDAEGPGDLGQGIS